MACLAFLSALGGKFKREVQFSFRLGNAGNALFLSVWWLVNNKRRKKFHLLAKKLLSNCVHVVSFPRC